MSEIHDDLVRAYLDYFKKSEIWERKRSVRTYYEVQKSIRKVRDLAETRHKEIRHKHQTRKDKDKE
jgi:hypothetical protein